MSNKIRETPTCRKKAAVAFMKYLQTLSSPLTLNSYGTEKDGNKLNAENKRVGETNVAAPLPPPPKKPITEKYSNC